MTLISVSNASVEFGATTLFKDISFTVDEGDRWGIVGRNGTGKTTLFKLITGAQRPATGAIAKNPNLKISMLDQHRDFEGATTVWEAAAGPFAELLALEQSLADQANRLGESSTERDMDRYSRDLERFEREGGYTFAPRVDAVLHGLGFDPVEARTQQLEHLSGGERGRVGLARQLVSPADVLLLDEPTNHLDLDTTRWLESYLITETNKTILLVSHDRAFLAAVVDHVLHFEGETATSYNAGYEEFVRQRIERRLAMQRAYDKQSRVISGEQDYIARNLAGQNSKQAKGRRKRLERVARLSSPVGESGGGSMGLRLETSERGGDQVVVARNVSISIDDRVLIRGLTSVVNRGDRLGIIAPNGAGKSTFLKTLVGDREPASGTLSVGGSITVAYYRQDMAQVPSDKTLYNVISDMRPAWERGMVFGHLGRFGFSGDETARTAATLSGGERARVALAMMMLSKANLLMLDEPTNHLDVESIEALEDAVEGYEGTVILVSHDRALLRALCTRVWVVHETHVTDFGGSFAEWEVASEEREHAAKVSAEEDEALRRVHEKQKTRRKESEREKERGSGRASGGGSGGASGGFSERDLKRRAEQCESRVSELEARVAKLTHELEDPELYATPKGTARAVGLGKDLDRARAELDRGLEEWASAVEGVAVR